MSKFDTHLPDHRALKNDKHEQGEEAVVPVLVQTPESDTEHLEDEERCRCVLSEKGSEGWNWDIELVLAIEVEQLRNFLASEPFRSVVCPQRQIVRGRIREVDERHWVG